MSREEVRELVGCIERAAAPLESVRLMEVCGTHTVSLFRSGLKSLLPAKIRLVSGPGCPVCVTTQGWLDTACQMASRPGVTLCTYGDMVRVPGREGSLEKMRAEGARVRVVYSARDALRMAEGRPEGEVVFLAVGFETTAPATAAVLIEAAEKDVRSFFVFAGHKLIIPAMEAILSSGEVAVDGFLLPGHVSVIIGADAYRPLVDAYAKPCVVTGFEPVQMLRGILALVEQIARGEAELGNVYGVAVTGEGNVVAQELMRQVFEPAAADWRAMGTIPESGLALRPDYGRFDALEHFGLEVGPDWEPAGCLCGQVIQGRAGPADCTLFGTDCTPSHPVGPCMVSSEGSCAAWYKYGPARLAGRE